MSIQEPLPLAQDAADEWHLDDHTREIGRQGLAEARAALERAAGRAEARDVQRRLAHAA